MRDFSSYYNHHHRHSGIGLYPPAAVHDGSWKVLREARQDTLDAAWRARPDPVPSRPPHSAEGPCQGLDQQAPQQHRKQSRFPHFRSGLVSQTP